MLAVYWPKCMPNYWPAIIASIIVCITAYSYWPSKFQKLGDHQDATAEQGTLTVILSH